MGVTMKDVAKQAGVSIKTVSNVLNGYAYLTPETRAKVEEALSQLDYRPNIAARNLRRGRTGVIALALPNLRTPYFSEIADRVIKEATARGLTVLLDATEGEVERERLVAEGFRSQLLDGIILQPWSVSAQFLRQRGDTTPLVLLGERRVRKVDSVAIDSRAAARAAVGHLLGLGRRRIGAIGAEVRSKRGSYPQEERWRHTGYQEALSDAEIPLDPDLLAHPTGDHTPEAAAQAVDDLLARAPDVDGIFAFNDRVALGVIRRLISRGVQVPGDIAVIGIDDIEAARLSAPSLSTIAPDKAGIAQTALQMLADRIDGAEGPARHIVADFTLVERESA